MTDYPRPSQRTQTGYFQLRQRDRRGQKSKRLRGFAFEKLEPRRLLAADLVKDMHLVPANSNPNEFALVNSSVLFAATVDGQGNELWASNGTAAQTGAAQRIRPGALSSFPAYLTVVNGILYFSANDGVNGAELWRSDGTAAGTRRWSRTFLAGVLAPTRAI